MDSDRHNCINVSIIGGGLVGALEACLMARRGYKVTIYESRHDGRKQQNFYGRSINLAISHRGIRGLKLLGLDHLVKELAIPMSSRMIHDLSGSQKPIPYDPEGRFINSIERARLNNYLLDLAEQKYEVEIKFQQRLVDIRRLGQSLETVFLTTDADGNETLVKNHTDLVFGCDGARSTVRSIISRIGQVETTQTFIEHSYLELRIDAGITKNGDTFFRMPENHLHIWPRGKFMMIALPNQDKTFTCTLFIPTKLINDLKEDPEKIVVFFEKYFPDSIDLIGRENIKETLTKNRPASLISIKCNPYNYKGRILLLGDSAHAMVPFYGQGMNCGFEDCVVLDELLDQISTVYPFDEAIYEKIFDLYSKQRVANGQAMSELAMYNYIEMRDLVNTWSFKARKLLDDFLYRQCPNIWTPLYTMVTFTHIPIDECVRRRAKQDNILRSIQKGGFIAGIIALSSLGFLKLKAKC